jgi:hypothetical protein
MPFLISRCACTDYSSEEGRGKRDGVKGSRSSTLAKKAEVALDS